jgi:hypothetical protein
MAIEIAPIKKEASFKGIFVLIFSIIVLLVCFGVYFYFSQIVLPPKKLEVNKLNLDLTSIERTDIATKEAEIDMAAKYIDDFKILFNGNPKASVFFGVFQQWAHPRIVYSDFSFDIIGRTISMKGRTNGFQNVMQQIAVLDKESTVESYGITNVGLAESGGVTFDLDLILKPEILK